MAAKTVKIDAVNEDGSAVKMTSDKGFFRVDPRSVNIVWDNNPRTEPIEDFEGFKADIRERGQLVPCVGTYDETSHRITLTSGYTRAKALLDLIESDPKNASKYSMLIHINTSNGDAPANGLSSLLLNIRDNNIRNAWTVLDKAKAAGVLKTEHGYKNVDIAKLFGCSGAYIGKLIDLLELPEDLKEAVEAGDITPSDAVKEFPKLDKETRMEALHKAKGTKKKTGSGMKSGDVKKYVEKSEEKKSGETKATAAPKSRTAAKLKEILMDGRVNMTDAVTKENIGGDVFPISKAIVDYLLGFGNEDGYNLFKVLDEYEGDFSDVAAEDREGGDEPEDDEDEA